MQTRTLTASPLLLQCGSPINSKNQEEILSYASEAVKTLLGKDWEDYEALKLSVYDGVLTGKYTVSSITRRKYRGSTDRMLKRLMPCVLLNRLVSGSPLFICSIKNGDNGYTVMPPRRVSVSLKGNTKGLEAAQTRLSSASRRHHPILTASLRKKTDLLWLGISSKLMRDAANDRIFMTRFNAENFFKGIDERIFSLENLDLFEGRTRIYFAALYAMTFYGLDLKDIFSVDQVFTFSSERTRSKDDIKHEAAMQLCEALKRDDAEELSDIAVQMGKQLLNTAPPALNVQDTVALAQGCAFYEGIAGIGNAYINATGNCPETWLLLNQKLEKDYKPVMERAKLFAEYENAVRLCDSIIFFDGNAKKGVSSLDGFKKAKKLENSLQLTVTSKQ